jgi:hypothetical protein
MKKDSKKSQKAVKKKQPRVKTQHSRKVHPEEYANTVQLVTEQHLYSTTTYHLALTESKLSENMTKDPLSKFFLNKRT